MGPGSGLWTLDSGQRSCRRGGYDSTVKPVAVVLLALAMGAGLAFVLADLANQPVTEPAPPPPVATPKREPPPPPPVPVPSVPPFQEARTHLERGDLDAAASAIRAGLAEEPGSAEGHALLALVQIRRLDFVGARSLLDMAASFDAELPLAAEVRGHLAMAQAAHREAARWYSKALERSESRDARAGLAKARFHLGEFAGAVEDATKAGDLFTRAMAYASLDRLDLALRDWETHTTAHSADAQGWVNRGNVEARLRLTARAAASWRKAISADPSLKERLAPLVKEAEAEGR